MSAGQMGHLHGTDGTRPRDGWDPKGDVSCQISLCLFFFSLPGFFWGGGADLGGGFWVWILRRIW